MKERLNIVTQFTHLLIVFCLGIIGSPFWAFVWIIFNWNYALYYTELENKYYHARHK